MLITQLYHLGGVKKGGALGVIALPCAQTWRQIQTLKKEPAHTQR